MNYLRYVALVFCALFSGCSGCSKSGRIHRRFFADTVRRGSDSVGRAASRDSAASVGPSVGPTVPSEGDVGRTTVKMEKHNGVYQIPVTINGSQMYFIFDTGAGLISISTIEATFLYKQGRLSDDDVVGKADFLDANGNISQDVIIRLKEVTIGNRTIRNVNASVVGNAKAPLLFGQSALEKFGKISIDYGKGEISFE
ncbi:MAG TPA: retropepsin-like aspartic protease [Puia sp.]|jgi:aspartyl protease family protein|nr:retropepsin-like aspartic protease [Puia sp.]